MERQEIHFDVDRVLNLVSNLSDIQIKDSDDNYSWEWLTQDYIKNVFEDITNSFKNSERNNGSIKDTALEYDELSKVTVPVAVSELIKLLNQKIGEVPTHPVNRGTGGSQYSEYNEENHDEEPNQDQNENQNDQVIENENLIATAIGAVAFQTPITLFSTIGGESVQTSSETEYGILGIENKDGTMYYKMIDKKTGKIYYAKMDDVKLDNQDIEILHTKDNALILNSTDIGSDDNFVKLAEPDSYYVVTDKQEINGVNFATILDSTNGNKYYTPISESVEVLTINQLGSDGVVDNIIIDTNTEDSNFDVQVTDETTEILNDDNSNIESTMDNEDSITYSDDDVDIYEEDNSSNQSSYTEILDDSEYSDSNYVPEDSINDPKYTDDSEMLYK